MEVEAVVAPVGETVAPTEGAKSIQGAIEQLKGSVLPELVEARRRLEEKLKKLNEVRPEVDGRTPLQLLLALQRKLEKAKVASGNRQTDAEWYADRLARATKEAADARFARDDAMAKVSEIEE